MNRDTSASLSAQNGASSATVEHSVDNQDLPPIPLEYFGSFQNVLVEKKVQPGWKLLEIGCSAGYYSQRLVERGAQVFGMDLNTELVAKAARHCAKGRFCSAEASQLPFATASFDAVVMLEVIEHVGEEPPVVEEIVRVLKP